VNRGILRVGVLLDSIAAIRLNGDLALLLDFGDLTTGLS
jgi:hypothetical protein